MKDSTLTSRTIQGNLNMTTVTIRFKMVDSEVNVQEPVDSVGVAKYKRVSPAQLQRDTSRAEEWKNKGDK